MSTKIRLKRGGRKKSPFYTIIVIDSRSRRDGRPIESLGWHNPFTDETNLNAERYEHWCKIGAIPSERMLSIAKKALVSSVPVQTPA